MCWVLCSCEWNGVLAMWPLKEQRVGKDYYGGRHSTVGVRYVI